MKWITTILGGLCLVFIPACAPTPRPQASPTISLLPSSTPPSSYPSASPVITSLPQGYVPPTAFTPPTDTPGPSPTPWPSIGYDLLFLSPIDANNYKLMRWSHLTARSDVLITDEAGDLLQQSNSPAPSRIVHFSVSADNKKLAIVRIGQKPKGAALIDEYELTLFDIQTSQPTSLARFETPVIWDSISPDGQWLAFMLLGTPRRILALNIGEPEREIEIGSCDEECGGFAWSPDSRTIAWSDSQGVWISFTGDSRPRLIAPRKSLILTNGRMGIYAPSPWSPNGQYLLIRSQDFVVGETTIVDTQSGRLGILPDSREYPYPNVHSVWLNDGTLFVVRNGDAYVKKPPSLEVWRIDSDADSLLKLEKQSDIPVSSQTYPTAPTQFDDGRLAFVLLALSEANSAESGLYTLSTPDYLPQRFSDSLPFFDNPTSVYASWLPDGAGAIIHSEAGLIQRIFVPASDKVPSHFPDLGIDSTCCFVWLK